MSTYLECLHAQNRARHTAADWRECARLWRECDKLINPKNPRSHSASEQNAVICDHIADSIEKEVKNERTM